MLALGTGFGFVTRARSPVSWPSTLYDGSTKSQDLGKIARKIWEASSIMP